MEIEWITLVQRTILGVREVVKPEGLTEFFGRALDQANPALQKQGAEVVGAPVAVYRGDQEHGFDVTAGFPVVCAVAPSPGVEVVELPAGRAIAAMHLGSYDSMEDTYAEIAEWMRDQHLTPGESRWEEYLTGPETSPDPTQWRTRIVFPLS